MLSCILLLTPATYLIQCMWQYEKIKNMKNSSTKFNHLNESGEFIDNNQQSERMYGHGYGPQDVLFTPDNNGSSVIHGDLRNGEKNIHGSYSRHEKRMPSLVPLSSTFPQITRLNLDQNHLNMNQTL